MKKILLLFCVFFCANYLAKAQQNKADSLEKLLPQQMPDTTRVNVLNQLAFSIYSINPDKSRKYADEALETAKKNNFQTGVGFAYINIGQYYRQKGEFAKALENLTKALEVFERIKHVDGVGNAYITIGLINGQQSNFSQAHEFHMKALKLYESIDAKDKVAVCLSNIGYTYLLQNEHNLALEYYFKSLPISKAANDTWREVLCYNNIGSAYSKKGEYDTALVYFKRSIDLAKVINLPTGRTLIAMGETYLSKKAYQQSLQTLAQALESFEKTSNKYYIAESSNALGKTYLAANQIDSALFFYKKGLSFSQVVGARAFISKAYEGVSKAYNKKNQIDSAYKYQTKFVALKDSIYNEEIFRKTAFAKFAYDLDKKQTEIAILQEQHSKEVVVRNMIIAFAILMIGGSVMMYRNSKKLQKAYNMLNLQNVEIQKKTNEIIVKSDEIMVQNEELQQQQEEIMAQRELIESQNAELSVQNEKISQSILAALTIQKSILSSDSKIRSLFADYFIYYKPKDVVSGDFYWFGKRDNTVVAAAMDCTGHGVPAAFMTMIINGLMERLVLFTPLVTPGELLMELHYALNRLLQQQETGDDNGMDVAIVYMNEATKNSVSIQYSGAKNDIFIVRHETKTLEVIKASRKSIGGKQNIKNEPFANHTLELSKGSYIYMGSDGFADQNNAKRERFGKQRLIDCVTKVMHKSLPEQLDYLTSEMHEFQQGEAQRDDMLLIGLKL